MNSVLTGSGARIRRLGRELGWVVFGQTLAFLGAFASIKLLTNALGTRGYGELALGLTIAGALHMFIYGPIEQTVLRFASVYDARGSLGSFAGQVASFNRIVGGWVLGAACLAGLVVWAAAGTEWALLVVAGIVFSILVGAGASLNSLLTGLRERRIVALYQGVEPWMRLLAALAAVALIHSAGHVAMLGFITGTLLAVAIEFLYTRKTRPDLRSDVAKTVARDGTDFRKHFLHYGAPFMLFAAFAAVSAFADRWILLAGLGTAAVGIYAAVFQIANAPILMFTGITNQLFVPVIFERAARQGAASGGSEAGRLIRITLRLYLVGMSAFVAVAWLLGKALVELFTSPEFAEYGNLLWIIALGLAISSVGQVLVLKGLSLGESRGYVAPKALQAASFLVAALLLVGPFGIAGVAWALCLSSVCYVAAVAAANRRLIAR